MTRGWPPSSTNTNPVLAGRALRCKCTLSRMVIPLEKVRRLGDFSGLWWLSLRCRCCRHMAEIPAQKLIERYGAQTLLKDIARRLYCRRCQEKFCHCRGKNFEAMVGMRR